MAEPQSPQAARMRAVDRALRLRKVTMDVRDALAVPVVIDEDDLGEIAAELQAAISDLHLALSNVEHKRLANLRLGRVQTRKDDSE